MGGVRTIGDQVRLTNHVAAAVAVTLFVPVSDTLANEYEVFVDIETEEDLYDLLASEDIGEDTFNALLELFQRGVNLNRASRGELYTLPNLTYSEVDGILAYREQVGWIDSPAALVAAGILTDKKFLSIAPFLVVQDRKRTRLSANGRFSAQTRYSQEDGDTPPPLALRAHVNTLRHLTVGAAFVVTRQRVGDVAYDANRNALSATNTKTRPHLPKFYAQWDTESYQAIAGTYRIGFGQRLVFDNTDQYEPHGIYRDNEVFRSSDLSRECKRSQGELEASPCAGEAGDIYVTPDFSWRDSLTGGALGAKAVEIGTGWVSAHAFASHQPRGIYQYELHHPSEACMNPRDDDNEACSSPDVFHRNTTDSLAPSSRFSFHTLPNMYRETTVGGNVSYFASQRTHVGLTAYRSSIDWLVNGFDLDFQEWSRRPFGGPFGAFGADAAWGRHWLDVFVEVAHSFDDMTGGGGGVAAIARTTATWKNNEIETSVRYYDKKFANPYARPISASDQFEGLRARDEAGGRIRYTGRITKQVSLRTSADFWVQPSDELPKTLVFVRSDVEVSKRFAWGLWAQYQNKDLGNGGRGQCFEISVEEDERGEPIPCGGEKIRGTGRIRYRPSKKTTVSLQLQAQLLDDAKFDDKYRTDTSAWVSIVYKPNKTLWLRGRSRYLFEDISDNEYLEQSLWTYVDATYKLSDTYTIRGRYDLYWWLDNRLATNDRLPSPENRLWVELQGKL